MTGRRLIAIRIVLVLVGLLSPWLGRLGLGRLPGGIVIERGAFHFYFPIVTCVVVSAVPSLILWLLNRCAGFHLSDQLLDETKKNRNLPRWPSVGRRLRGHDA
jgi:hypothetical protein